MEHCRRPYRSIAVTLRGHCAIVSCFLIGYLKSCFNLSVCLSLYITTSNRITRVIIFCYVWPELCDESSWQLWAVSLHVGPWYLKDLPLAVLRGVSDVNEGQSSISVPTTLKWQWIRILLIKPTQGNHLHLSFCFWGLIWPHVEREW